MGSRRRRLAAQPAACLLLAGLLQAQQPKAVVPGAAASGPPSAAEEAASFRVTQSLSNSVAIGVAPFRLHWSASRGSQRTALVRSGEASGIVTADYLRLQGESTEWLVAANGCVLMRTDDQWVPPPAPRKSRPSPSSPRAMLQAVGSELPQILHSQVTILDDRPAEVFTLRMSMDQQRLLAPMFAHAEAPDEFVNAVVQSLLSALNGDPKFRGVVDVALTIEPSTKFVRRLQLRATVLTGAPAKPLPQPVLADGLPVRDAADDSPMFVNTLDFRFDPDPKREEPLLDAKLRERLLLKPDPREARSEGR